MTELEEILKEAERSSHFHANMRSVVAHDLKKILLAFLTLAAFQANADVDGLTLWQPHENGVRYLFPKVPGIAPTELAHRYAEALKSSAVYGQMEGASNLGFSSSPKVFSDLPHSTSEHPNVAVVLNRPAQMLSNGVFLSKTVRAFEKEGPRLFAIPIGLETVLSADEMKQFRAQINSMDGLLGMGGDDVHPALFGQTDTSRTRGDISVERDREQIAYIHEYLERGKGRAFLICGSLQRAAVMDGHTLHDDIGHLTKTNHMNVGTELAIVEVVAEEGSELAMAAGKTRFLTTNAHHAAVNPESPRLASPAFKVTAYNIEPDGTRGSIVKAMEFPGHAGFGTQFHPELGSFPEEKRILKYVATGWKLRARVPPSAILECLVRELHLHF